jgi:hypothetical protein
MENKDFYLESIDKNKYSESQTEKFKVLKCQQLVDNNTDTTSWILLEDIIKQNKDLKILKGLLLPKYSIIVKIGKSETIKKEYDMSQMLLNIPGFIRYLCYFSCNNNIHKIITNSSICAKDGDLLKILVMKEYPLGNLKNFNWNKENFHVLKSIIKQCIASLYLAFKNHGFIHNDAHFGNILLKECNNNKIEYDGYTPINLFGYRIIIMDFENSLIDETKSNYSFLYKIFGQIINGIKDYLNIRTNKIIQIMQFLFYYENNNSDININELFALIEQLEFIEKLDLTKFIKYNPNIF